METLTATCPTSETSSWHPPTAARIATASLFFINGALFATWVSRIPAIQEKLGLDPQSLGLALLGVALGALIAMPVAGWCITKAGSRRTVQAIAVAFCLLTPLLALAPNLWTLALALVAFGAAHGAFDVAMNAQAVRVEELYRRPIMSSFHALWSVGGLTGAALGGLIASTHLPPLSHFMAASLLLGGATLTYALPRLLEAGESNAPIKIESHAPHFARPSGRLIALGALAFCIMMGEGAMADWSALFLRDVGGASEAMAATGYAAFSIAMAVARFAGDALSARHGATSLVRSGSVLSMCGLAIALFIPQPAVALIGFAAVGAGFATIVPQVFSAAGRIPGVASGPAIATATTVGYSGFLVGPPAIGFAAQHLGLQAALGLVVISTATAILLAPSVNGKTCTRDSG